MMRTMLMILALAGMGDAPTSRGCTVLAAPGVQVTSSHIERVRSVCGEARRRFGELFGPDVPQVRVVIWDRTGYRTGLDGEVGVVYWPQAGPAGVARYDPAALPHEIGHVLLAARFRGAAGAADTEGYGTRLPDWLDEGVAVWTEPRGSREARLAQGLRLPGDRLDLRSIVTAPHPAAARPDLLRIRDGAPPPAGALEDFYRQAITALTFIREAGGVEALEAVAEAAAVAGDRPVALRALTGLEEDDAAIVRAWRAWLSRSGSRSSP